MDADTMPPNWPDLVEHSSELATKNDFDLAEEWFSVQPNLMPDHERFQTSGADRISDLFAIMTDSTTSIQLDTSRPKPRETGILSPVIPVSKGGNKQTPLHF